MPTYEFRCPAGHDVERSFKISDAPGEVECPTCGAMAARRISGGAGLLFKGTGFYITDYGKDGKKDQREGGKAAAGKSGGETSGSSSSGGDAKPAANAKSEAPAKSSESSSPKAPTKAAGE
jgi:putative FmdB family regulatory protein